MIRRALLALVLMSAPQLALACGNEVEISTKEAKKLLARAEKLLAQGKNAEVVELVADVEVEDPTLGRRLNRVLAVANLRNDHISIGLELLRTLLRDQPDDPYLKTRLAEGLSLLRKDKEKNRAEARRLLEELAAADLIPDAEGYLVLARLRRGAGDLAQADQALEQCKARGGERVRCIVEGDRGAAKGRG